VPTKNDVSVNPYGRTANADGAVVILDFVLPVGLVQSNHVREVLSTDGVLRRRLDIPVADRHRTVDQFYVPRENHVGKRRVNCVKSV